ncbi:hypothetical protein DY000_02009494 [Brassica cretica]|uniref:Uncharacterized protein n=1 Tax=Brassica cretica TaxID=69181 RepID=A0ABQ7BXH1_BRACR|nr:hypothetical protein DY000_02009494 [Brassica cretica]
MYSYVVIEEAESGEFSGIEWRRFGEFSEVTEESEFQNLAPVVMDMKMVDTKVVARDEEMVVDTVEVEDGRVGGYGGGDGG